MSTVLIEFLGTLHNIHVSVILPDYRKSFSFKSTNKINVYHYLIVF